MKNLFTLIAFIASLLLVGCDAINDSNNDDILTQKDIIGKYIGKFNMISMDEAGNRKSLGLIEDTIIVSAINATRIKYESKILGVFYGNLNLDKATSSKIPVSIDEQTINSPIISTAKNDLVVNQVDGSSFDFGKGKINNNSQLKVSSKSGGQVETDFMRSISIILDTESRDIPLIQNTGG